MGMTTDSLPATGIGPSANSSVAPVLGRPEEVGFARERLARLDAAMQATGDDCRLGGISGEGGVAGRFANGPGNEVRRLYLEAGLAEGTSADMVVKIAAIPLASQPGTQFQYGLSQDVQGRIVEVLSGQRLDEFLRTRILEPLGMPDTDFAVRPNELHRLVPLAGYDGSLSLVPARQALPGLLFGAAAA